MDAGAASRRMTKNAGRFDLTSTADPMLDLTRLLLENESYEDNSISYLSWATLKGVCVE